MIVTSQLWPAPTTVGSQHTDSDRLTITQLINTMEAVKKSLPRELQDDAYVTGCSGVVARVDRQQTAMEVAQARNELFNQMRDEARGGRLSPERVAYYDDRYAEMA